MPAKGIAPALPEVCRHSRSYPIQTIKLHGFLQRECLAKSFLEDLLVPFARRGAGINRCINLIGISS